MFAHCTERHTNLFVSSRGGCGSLLASTLSTNEAYAVRAVNVSYRLVALLS